MSEVKSTAEGVLLPWDYLKQLKDPRLIMADVMYEIMKKVISSDDDKSDFAESLHRRRNGMNGMKAFDLDPKEVFKV